MRIKRITMILVIGLLFVLTACSSPTATPPHLTAQQAQGLVIAAIEASTPAILLSSSVYETEFNYSNRQWMVTVWMSEQNRKNQYGGAVYNVDDATGKVLNPPPVYSPK